MSLESDDEQLARALAASLDVQDRQRLVARTDEEEQEALSLAVAASLAEHEQQQQQWSRGQGTNSACVAVLYDQGCMDIRSWASSCCVSCERHACCLEPYATSHGAVEIAAPRMP